MKNIGGKNDDVAMPHFFFFFFNKSMMSNTEEEWNASSLCSLPYDVHVPIYECLEKKVPSNILNSLCFMQFKLVIVQTLFLNPNQWFIIIKVIIIMAPKRNLAYVVRLFLKYDIISEKIILYKTNHPLLSTTVITTEEYI